MIRSRAFVKEKGATFEIGRDPAGAVRRLYQGIGVPESYLISADGRLLVRQFGAIPTGAAAMRAAIEKALATRRTGEPPLARSDERRPRNARRQPLAQSSGSDSASRTCCRRASSFVMMIAARFRR